MSNPDDTETLLEATTALVPPLLQGLEALAYAARHLHPPALAGLVDQITGFRAPLAEGLGRFEAVVWPEHLQPFAAHSREAAALALEAFDALAGCLDRSNPVIGAFRALGLNTRAVEALYPVAFMLPAVNRFYLCEPERRDEALQAALIDCDPHRDGVGVMHAGNDRDSRGGFSLYVPETMNLERPTPLVVALHGGSGHGRGFLWTWLREARSRSAILIAPTSRDDTWSLMGPDQDSANLHAMVDHVRSMWPVDSQRILLTGMSDGGTFSYLCGLREDGPFTHLAPISASFHPLLLDGTSADRLQGLPVYLIHGALDWMFPVEVARMARDALAAAGARVSYHEIADLSHTYPREQNALVLDWLSGREPDDH